MNELEMTQITKVDEDESKENPQSNDNLDCADRLDEENTTEESDKNEADEEKNEPSDTLDFAEIERRDLSELKALFPNLKDKTSILELENPLRYAALRDLGLSPKEAYLATSEPVRKYDNRSHLTSSVPKSAIAPSDLLSRGELEAARELFSGLSDRELQRLYKKVSR